MLAALSDTELVLALAIAEGVQLVLLALIYAVAKIKPPPPGGDTDG